MHASEGSGEALGPCGTRWASPFEGMGSEQALAALPVLLQQQPTDLNAIGADGMLPADVAVRWGSERVAAALAELSRSWGRCSSRGTRPTLGAAATRSWRTASARCPERNLRSSILTHARWL